ncbi:MAG: transposase [Sulfobacillus sp.]
MTLRAKRIAALRTRLHAGNMLFNLKGRHFTKPTPTRKSPEFADFLLQIAASYPAADTIHLVLDNLSTHTRKARAIAFQNIAKRLVR